MAISNEYFLHSLILIAASIIVTEPFTVDLTVTSSIKSETSSPQYLLVDGYPASFKCDYGLPKSQMNYVEIYKGNDIIFDYQKQGEGAFIRNDVDGRASFEFLATALVLNVTEIQEEHDRKPLRCFCQEPGSKRTPSQQLQLAELLQTPPTKSELNNILHVNDTKEKTYLPKGFKSHTFKSRALNSLSTLKSPTISWTGSGLTSKVCDGQNNQVDDTVCELTVHENDLQWGQDYSYQVKAELFYSSSDSKTVKFKYGDKTFEWWKILLIVLGVATPLLILVLFLIKRHNS